MNAKPDENRDVIVHYMKIHEIPGGQRRETWSVWLGQENGGDHPTLEKALASARQLARANGRQAWLQDDGGYPLKPIDLEPRE